MITFLKLGGSVITDKSKPMTPRLETIQRLAEEIATAHERDASLRILLGHGSGSFGHAAAAEHGTHLGAKTTEDWLGFIDVWYAAQELNRIVTSLLKSQGLPVISFPPSASALSEAGELVSIALDPIKHALDAGLLPVVYGDVVFDRKLGAAITSTEAVFALLAKQLAPQRMLLAGREDGVYETLQAAAEPLPEITPAVRARLNFSDPEGEDVTGGMAAKVDLCLEMAEQYPGLEILIFSAEKPGQLLNVLSGASAGTRIRN